MREHQRLGERVGEIEHDCAVQGEQCQRQPMLLSQRRDDASDRATGVDFHRHFVTTSAPPALIQNGTMNHATAATYAPSRRNARRMAAIARYTLLEAWRNRLIVLVIAAVALLTLLSLFARELAITESGRLQTAILASTLRVASV